MAENPVTSLTATPFIFISDTGRAVLSFSAQAIYGPRSRGSTSAATFSSTAN
jgi:hypothetical protein